MKREILFRGKRTGDGQWVEGNYCHDEFLRPRIQGISSDGFWWFEIIPETLSQFTGLIDRKGKKIFEGDIIKGLTVSYCGDTDEGLGMQAGWYLQRNDFESFIPLESNLTDVVSGNIFDSVKS